MVCVNKGTVPNNARAQTKNGGGLCSKAWPPLLLTVRRGIIFFDSDEGEKGEAKEGEGYDCAGGE